MENFLTNTPPMRPGLAIDRGSLMDDVELTASIGHLVELTRRISKGKYDEADKLFELTKEGTCNPIITELAEAFGMMMVQVEGREFRLEGMIQELEARNRELQAILEKVRLMQRVQDHLSKFVSGTVKKMIEANPENPDFEMHNEDVTILFLDIAGYSRMSEQIDQKKVNYMVETYFSSFLDIILENRGDINETAGDGLMILFRDPDLVNHAVNAVKAARGIQRQAALINRTLPGLGEPVTINIGINSGACSVGSARFEGITGTRWTFTASGSITNVAARIAAIAANGDTLMGHPTCLRVQDHFPIESIGQHKFKNIAEPRHVYRLRHDEPD